MTNPCERFDAVMERFLAGEAEEEELRHVMDHADSCHACRAIRDIHHDLVAYDPGVSMPTDRELASVRRSVREAIRAEGARSPLLHRLHRTSRGTVFRLAAALVIALLGFGLGRWSDESPKAGEALGIADRADGPGDGLSDEIRFAASEHRELEDVENSPYLYSDVRLQEIGDGRVRLAFNVTTHMEIVRPVDDPLIGEVVAQALLHPASIGERLRAVDMSSAILDPRVRDALTKAMTGDPEVAVRLKALENLSRQPPDPELVRAFSTVLSNDDSVQMRIESIEYLSTHGITSETIEETLNQTERGRAVLAVARDRFSG